MRGVQVALVLLLLAGCARPATEPSPAESASPGDLPGSSAESSMVPSAESSLVPSVEISPPESVTLTFRLVLTGPVPGDAAFALQTGIVGDGGGANYLCSYYGGYPVCVAERAYEEAHAFAPGTRVQYRFWRELDVTGINEEIQTGEVTVGKTSQEISVTYAFP